MPYLSNENEKEILKFWEENKIFEKSVSERPEDKPYVFYDGPPFATGLPHYGHILSSVIKDVVPRYFTMKGYRVRRRWGWDCHGMPIENIIEKELNVSGKKKIEEEFGVGKFNEACSTKVLQYTEDWKKMVTRMGRWVEFDDAYKTMDSTYMESVWWALKTAWDKELIYEGRKVLMYCPRCETPVSKAEIAMDNSYKDITEETLTAKFKVKDPEKHDLPVDTFILAWTTTPWTLPGNVALAVGEEIEYVLVESNGEKYIVAKERLDPVFKAEEVKIIKEFLGSDLVGIEYEPLFDLESVKETGKKAWYVTSADFVTTEEGTGVVHTAVIYGEDDFALGMKIDLPMVPLLDSRGHFNEESPELVKGKYFKGAEKEIKADLEVRGLVFEKKNHTHSYPHCWRCETQLFYNAISAWFINIQKIKKRLIKLNEKINWYPEHLKHGRFLHILETAPDWNISRNRYWATPLPFWKCECGHTECIGSVKELKEKAINYDEVYGTDKVEDMDLHKQHMDKIKVKCEKCGKEVQRIPEVIDCWVESSSMPFAEFHFPFENKETFEGRFPGQYIAEYIAQTRAWFYYMLVMSTVLFDDVSFENCVTTGTILNDKGEKLSKSKMNYTDPWEIIEKYGMDALRYYLMTSVVMQAENLQFNDREVKEVYNKVINILWNVVTFYKMYAPEDSIPERVVSENVLDVWIVAKLHVLMKEVTVNMDNYSTVKAGRPIKEFIAELSTWYVRRSRDRFKTGEEKDKENAIVTLRYVLFELSKLMAPFTPFIAEKIYKEVGGELESVHLEMWSEFDEKLIDEKVLEDMKVVRKIVEMGMSIRKETGNKVRQPLQKLEVVGCELSDDLLGIIADELNLKEVKQSDVSFEEKENQRQAGELVVELDLELTEELKKEGLLREVVRAVNMKRKDQKLSIGDMAVVEYSTEDEMLKSVFTDFEDELKTLTVTKELKEGGEGEEIEISGRKLKLLVKKV